MTSEIAVTGATAALPTAVRKTLVNTFIAVAGSCLISAAAAYALLETPPSLGLSLGLLVASLVVLLATQALRNSVWGLAGLALFAGLMGASAGPALGAALKSPHGAQAAMAAFGLAAAACAGCTLYAVSTRRSFSNWRAFLLAGLVVLLLGSLLNVFLAIPALAVMLSAAASLLFTAWLLYDVSRVVTGEETNYISAALGIYLNVLNLFMSLLNLFGGGDD